MEVENSNYEILNIFMIVSRRAAEQEAWRALVNKAENKGKSLSVLHDF